MPNVLLGAKLNMSRRFNKIGYQIPVTLITAEPNIVLVKKSNSVVIGMGAKKKVKKTENAFVKVAGFSPRFIKEVKTSNSKDQESTQEPKPGDKISVSIFEPGDEVKITGTTKGRGFAGVVKRHGFHGGPKTHGQSDRHRAPGSIGAGTTPGRVYKGKRMAGHMGASQITITGLEVIEVDEKTNTITVKGAVPGARNGLLIIEKTGKVKGYVAPPEPNEQKQAAQEGEPRSSDEREEKEQKAESQALETADQETVTTENQTEAKETPTSETKEKIHLIINKKIKLHSKNTFNKLVAYLGEKREQYETNMRNSRLLKKSDGISEFFKSMSEVEKGNGTIEETFEDSSQNP